MPMFKRHQRGLDTQPLLDALDANPELWGEITVRQEYPGSAHRDTQCIFLRGPAAFTPHEYQGTLDAHDYPALDVLRHPVEQLLKPVLQSLGATELGYVLLVVLHPNGQIAPHTDEGAYAGHYSRFHIALTHSPEAFLTVGGHTQTFAQGELWEFNHRAPHQGANLGANPRIHLIFDAVVPEPLVHVPRPDGPTLAAASFTGIRESTVDEILAGAATLFTAHWDEIALNKRLMQLQPDVERYRALDAQGGLLALGAYVDGQLVGYSVNFLMNHLHYAGLKVCSNDLLFVAKEHRHGRLGLQLIKRTEAEAKTRGAQMVLWHAKPGTALNELMPRLGYGVQDIIYSKEV